MSTLEWAFCILFGALVAACKLAAYYRRAWLDTRRHLTATYRELREHKSATPPEAKPVYTVPILSNGQLEAARDLIERQR